MPKKYIPHTPNTVEGQAILNNFYRTNRLLQYRDNNKVYDQIERGMPLYETKLIEKIGNQNQNLVIRGECVSACAYLKEQNIKVDLVYIDPPFASGADYAKKVYIRRNPKLAQIIREEELKMNNDDLQVFEEKMYGDIWKKEDYLNWMYENLQAIKSVMKNTATIYVHLDYHIGHYVKILLDEIFGESNFRNEIVWRRQIVRGMKTHAEFMPHSAESIYIYTKSNDYLWNIIKAEKEISIKEAEKKYMKDERGYFRTSDPGSYTNESLIKLFNENRIYVTNNGSAEIIDGKLIVKNGKIGIKYYREQRGNKVIENKVIDNIWEDIPGMGISPHEYLDYSTQKPEALLKRIIEASTNNNMIIADFFGGSGVTAKVANDLQRKFIHTDIGINSIQTVRDRLINANAEFNILEITDGINLFRNPVQTMDKLGKLIPGLQQNTKNISKFWFGTIQDSNLGSIPVYVPNLLDSNEKILNISIINKIINQELLNLNKSTKKIIVYYIDIDHQEIEEFIRNNNGTKIKIELKDLKNLLQEVVIEDIINYKLIATNKEKNITYELSIENFTSDRLMQKINEFNEKGNLQASKNNKIFSPITISENGLEIIELISLDCTNKTGTWISDSEIKIDKLGYITINGKKNKEFWNGKIKSNKKPLRLKIRNISGDETITELSLKNVKS